MDLENPYASPLAEVGAGVTDAGAPGEGEIYREKDMLVFHRGAVLPGRCIVCNAPTGERLKKKLQWFYPIVYLLILLNVLFFLIIYLALRKTVDVSLGMCTQHLALRKARIIWSWLWVALGLTTIIVGLILAGAASELVRNDSLVAVIVLVSMIGGAAMLVTGAVLSNRANQFQIKRIDKQYVRLRKVSAAYLAELPEFTSVR